MLGEVGDSHVQELVQSVKTSDFLTAQQSKLSKHWRSHSRPAGRNVCHMIIWFIALEILHSIVIKLYFILHLARLLLLCNLHWQLLESWYFVVKLYSQLVLLIDMFYSWAIHYLLTYLHYKSHALLTAKQSYFVLLAFPWSFSCAEQYNMMLRRMCLWLFVLRYCTGK